MKQIIKSSKQLIQLLTANQTYYKLAMDCGIGPPTIWKVINKSGGLRASTFFNITDNYQLTVFIQKFGETLVLKDKNQLRDFAITLAKYEGKSIFFASTRCRWERGATPKMSVFFKLLDKTGHQMGVMSDD